ncbi:MAG: FMN-binding glutamate synthase family protein [Deltaproteobacteria bacterium]|nr:FMN-binding glutamate synthase family protein [Deltaproteobacteria bacterium]MCB9785685.1 FMN-binding glutamate synthase family protein [Deltaproteobacteria bacterium]
MTALAIIGGLLLALVIYDLTQRKHAILRNFPIIGHFRYLLEAVGPELRQYIVTDNDEERPFSRDQRRWVYSSSKKGNNYFGFGTDNDLEQAPHTLVIKHAPFPLPHPIAGNTNFDPACPIPCAKVLGAWRGRAKAFRPASIVNLSAMSYGSLSAPAVAAMNRGAMLAGCLHNTGEGGISDHHRHGGELIYQLGTAYFGSRDESGCFSMPHLLETVASAPVRALEIKLSQGAKPGMGGVLPKAKITAEIARIRGVSMGHDVVSPAGHSAFHDISSMLDFIEMLADATGLPVGIKSAVGELAFWEQLAHTMATTQRGPDYIQIDGGEGGTGAAPLVFSDHVAFPFKIAMSKVYGRFVEAGIAEHIVFIGAGRLGFPEEAALAMALGCDMVGVAREAMLAVGCIQAQRCHTDHCPTGVATNNRWLIRGLDPTQKSARLANYIMVLRKEILWLARATGVVHPALIGPNHFAIVDSRFRSLSLEEAFDCRLPQPDASSERVAELAELMEMSAPA